MIKQSEQSSGAAPVFVVFEGHDDAIADVVAELNTAGVTEIELDEIIHDIASSLGSDAANKLDSETQQAAIIDLWSLAASEVNNAGCEAQVRAIMGYCGGLKQGILHIIKYFSLKGEYGQQTDSQ